MGTPRDSKQWFFRPRQRGEAIHGGVNDYALSISIDTLVRESVQNINDQRVGDHATVEFVVAEHRGAELVELLGLIGWDEGLSDHLSAIAAGNNHLSERVQRALDSVKNGSVRSLLIRDLDCRGLEGSEDGASGNFAMLCRHVLVTEAENKALRGGSFGIGKSVLWAFSNASTVLFSSLPLERAGGAGSSSVGSPRFFGRSYLVSHEIGGVGSGSWRNGDGQFGTPREEDDGSRWVVSERGDAARRTVKGTLLDRDWTRTGTSILIPFLDDPRLDDFPSSGDFANRVTAAIQRWYWPVLGEGLLSARIGVANLGATDWAEIETPSWSRVFRRAIDSGRGQDRIEEPGGCASTSLEIKIPKRKSKMASGAIDAHGELCLTRLTDEEVSSTPDDVVGSVALVRGARMVVEYHKRTLPSLLPPFVGVLRAGTIRGDELGDEELEKFLRDSEPPSHDRWDPSSEKLGLFYARGAKGSLSKFISDIGDAVRRTIATGDKNPDARPEGLAKRLRGKRGSDDSPKPRSPFDLVSKELDRSTPGLIRASVSIRRLKPVGPWSATMRIVLYDEQQRKIPVVNRVEECKWRTVPADEVVITPIEDEEGQVVGLKAEIPALVEELAVDLASDVDPSILRLRSMADVIVTYGLSKNG